MKILIVNSYAFKGGASRAARRLESCLKDSRTVEVVFWAILDGETNFFSGLNVFVRKVMNRLPGYLASFGAAFFSTPILNSKELVNKINRSDFDVVHLHWVNGGALTGHDISNINKPVVWSLHDMWPFTGGCHYDDYCGGYKRSCGNCKVLRSAREYDLSRFVHERKQKSFGRKGNITLVGLSRWLANEAASSSLFSREQVVNLPNPIDTDAFSPLPRESARELLNLPQDKALILFGAMDATSDPRKGYRELTEALKLIRTKNIALVVFGANRPENGPELSHQAHYLGHIADDYMLRALYSAADVMVVPSLQENLSNAIMESLACGTPVVGFDIGGNSDLVDDQLNGYLATPFSIPDLAQGIEWVIYHSDYEWLAHNARQKVLQCFDNKVVAQKYIELYRSLLEKDRL